MESRQLILCVFLVWMHQAVCWPEYEEIFSDEEIPTNMSGIEKSSIIRSVTISTTKMDYTNINKNLNTTTLSMHKVLPGQQRHKRDPMSQKEELNYTTESVNHIDSNSESVEEYEISTSTDETNISTTLQQQNLGLKLTNGNATYSTEEEPKSTTGSVNSTIMNIETVAENNEILSSTAKMNISTNLQQQNLELVLGNAYISNSSEEELKHTTESVNSNDLNSIIVDKDNEVSSSTSKAIKQSILQKSDTLLWLNGSDSNSATKDEPKYTAEIVNVSNINFETGNIRSFDSTAENSTTTSFHLIYTTFGLTGLNKSDSVDVKLNYTTENHNSNTNNYRSNETEYYTPYFVPVTYGNLISSNKNYNKSTTTTNSNLIKPNTSTIVTKQNKSDLDTKQNNFTFGNTTNNIEIIEISTTYERKTPEDTKSRYFKINAEKEFLKSETYKTVKPLSKSINNHTQHRKFEPDIQNSLVTYAITQKNLPKVHEGTYQTHRKSYHANHSSNRYTAKAESKSRQNLGSNNNSSINNSIISQYNPITRNRQAEVHQRGKNNVIFSGTIPQIAKYKLVQNIENNDTVKYSMKAEGETNLDVKEEKHHNINLVIKKENVTSSLTKKIGSFLNKEIKMKVRSILEFLGTISWGSFIFYSVGKENS
uniref:Uncharacterized protein n=1 Tax=Homalodisca liturata TaxID=320908 RepID=A0A1B6JEY8_9HEMI